MPSTVSPVTLQRNTTFNTKSQQQILIQSSGAMIAVIVIGIIIILAIFLLILKTYNRVTHTSRVLGHSGGSKPRPRNSQSVNQSSHQMNTMSTNSVSGPDPGLNPPPQDLHLPRVELSSVEGNQLEQFSTTSSSTVVTIHGDSSVADT